MIRRTLILVSLLAGILVVVGAGTAWWAWQRQTALLIASANQVLAAYGVEVISIQGLSTGLQSSHADQIEFRLFSVEGSHMIHDLRVDYDARQLMRGHVQHLQAASVELNPKHPTLPDQASLRFTAVDIQCGSAESCSGALSLQAEIPRLDMPDLSLTARHISAQASVDIRYDAPMLRADITSGLTATLGSAATATLTVEQLSLTTQQPLRLTLNLDEQLLIADGGQLQAKVPVLRYSPDRTNIDNPGGLNGFDMTLDQINGSYDFSQEPDITELRSWQQRMNAQARVTVEKIYTSLVPLNLWSWRWQQELSWTPNQVLHVSSSASLAARNLLNIAITQDFSSRHGRATVQTGALDFSPGNLTLTDIISPLPVEADLIAGRLNVEAEFGWQIPADPAQAASQHWQIHGAITTGADGLAGFYEDTVFAGLNTQAHWQLEPDMTLVNREPALLQLSELNPGLALTDLSTRYYYNHRTQRLELRDTRLTLFGGSITAEPLTLDFAERTDNSAPDSLFNIHLDNIDISQLLSLSAYNQVSASGLIEGTLPVTLKGLTPLVAGGHLQARAPGGSIRYDSGSALSGNQSLDLVYQALRHYQYESLSASVDYLESGELILGMQLQGLSPELNNGQRINLNLNISDNIPALLQSLQAAQNMNERLQEMLE